LYPAPFGPWLNFVHVTVTFPFGPAPIHSLSLKKLPASPYASRFGELHVLPPSREVLTATPVTKLTLLKTMFA
jgi:hypothetical protein